MIKIYDGREEFYQWDLDQKFIVTDPEITEVHYFNHTTECAPVCEVYEEDGKRVVNIPNCLFQRAITIRAYLYNGCCTKGYEEFVVQRKPKPDDYVYTETEVKSWQELYDLIKNIDTCSCEATNMQKGTGKDATQQLPDKVADGFSFKGKNDKALTEATQLSISYLADNLEKLPYGAVGDYSSSFGGKSLAKGKRAHAEGTTTVAYGNYSHAEGDNSVSLGSDSHAEGYATTSSGNQSHSEGGETVARGLASHAEGHGTIAAGSYSHAEGVNTRSYGTQSHAEGNTTESWGNSSHTEGELTHAEGQASHAEGSNTRAVGNYSHAEGSATYASSESSHTEGVGTAAYGAASHSEGYRTTARGNHSHIEGASSNIVRAQISDVGNLVTHWTQEKFSSALGAQSHVEGFDNVAYGEQSHAEGSNNLALGNQSHVEGSFNRVYGNTSHAGGYNNIVRSDFSHVEGVGNISSARNIQFVCGAYNNNKTYTLFEVGNGDSIDDEVTRSNAFEVLKDGSARVYNHSDDPNAVVRNADLEGAVVSGLTKNSVQLTDEEKASAAKWLGVPSAYEGDMPEMLVDIPFTQSTTYMDINPDENAYLVSDKTFTKEELLSGPSPFYFEVRNTTDNTTQTFSMAEASVREFEGYVSIHKSMPSCTVSAYVVYDRTIASISGLTPPSNGIYFVDCSWCNQRFERLYREGKVIKPIENKYLDLANNRTIQMLLARIEALEKN